MSIYQLLLFAHLLLFVYWLGSDIGVFYGVRFVLNPNLSIETRKTVMALIHWIDALPRICLVMMVPVGLSLAMLSNLLVIDETWQAPAIALIWIVSVAWLLIVLRIYKGAKGIITLIDYAIRITVMAGFLIGGITSLLGHGPFAQGADFLAVKAMLFSGIIACGLMLRVLGKPFGTALGEILNGKTTPAIEAKLQRTMFHSRIVVLVLWLLVIVTAYIGLVKNF